MSRKQVGDIAAGRLDSATLARNFEDVAPPLTRQNALLEAQRCYYCYDAPCTIACPTGIDIPAFIRGITTDNLRGAAHEILSENIFGGSCARVCPTEILCEQSCVRNKAEDKPVEIGALQRYATDWVYEQHSPTARGAAATAAATIGVATSGAPVSAAATSAVGVRPLFERAPDTGKRIAIVGAGPAGLSCAHALARRGHHVTVFEAKPKPGGLNEYGIAAYKVPGFAQREVEWLLSIGNITVHHNRPLAGETSVVPATALAGARANGGAGPEGGRQDGARQAGTQLSSATPITLAELRRDYDAVFLAMGLGGVNALALEGENLPGVRNAVDFIAELRQTSNLATLPVGRRVVVIGGGNTAIDAAIQSKRLGAETVTLVYRRGAESMGATDHEQQFAKSEGVTILHWARPLRFLARDGVLGAVEFEYTQLDAAGKLIGTGDKFTLDADWALKAIGQVLTPPSNGASPSRRPGESRDPALSPATTMDPGLRRDDDKGADDGETLQLRNGRIAVDGNFATSLPGVWAGGDCVGVKLDLTVQAVEDGKRAAAAIHKTVSE